MNDEFGGIAIDEPQTDEFGGLPVDSFPAQERPPRSGLERAAKDLRLGPLANVPRGTTPPALNQSALGISPEMVPSGAGTRAPWLTIPLSVAGKTAAGIGGYLTSPQGATETALAATPAAPVIFAKWAYDMLRGGYKSTKAIVDELGQMANEALNKGIISANQLGPVPQGKTIQDHIQSLSENAANAALMALGGAAAGVHAAGRLGGRVVAPTPEIASPRPIPAVPEALSKAPEIVPRGTVERVPTPEEREFELLHEHWLPTIKPWRQELLKEEVAKGEGTSLSNIETNFQDSPGARDVVRAKRYYELARKLYARTGETPEPTEVTPNLPKEPPVAAQGESPTAPAVSEAQVAGGATPSTEPAKVEATPTPPSPQAPSVTPPVTEGIKTWHQTTPEAATKIQSEGFKAGSGGFLGPAVYVATTPDIVSSRLAGKPSTTIESTVSGKLLDVSETAPNRPLEILRQLMGDEEGTKFYDNNKIWIASEPNWELLNKLASEKGYVGYRQKDASGYDRIAVFDTKAITPSKPIGEAEMGAAGIKEIPETGAGGEKYGVAQRVREERAQAGQVEAVAPGKGMSTQQTIEMGRDIVRRDPEAGPRILEAFENDPKKATSTEGRAVVRAHGESLAAGARTIEETYGTESPEYRAAQAYLSDWDRRSKKMDTEFHKQGMAMQGETDIDTGSFTGLNRARQQATGKDITPAQKPKAEKIAADNKAAQDSVDQASATLKTRIREKNPANAQKAALDAASKTVREAAARMAQAENKARVAEESRRQSEEQVQKDAAELAEEKKTAIVRDQATKAARAENKARVAQAARDKEVANVQVKNAKKALDAAKKVEEAVRNRAIKEAQRRANDPSISVWEKMNQYLDENKGLYAFDDMVNRAAVDLKMPASKVRSILAQDTTTKRMATDLLLKQTRARRLKEQAKNWLRELDTPGYQKALMSLPNFMFSVAVGGHGFVALGTHAPILAFQPRFWGAYVRNFGRMYKMVFSPAYYEAQMQDLVRRSHTEEINGKQVEINDWQLANDSGLQNNPFKYEEFHTSFIRDMVKDWIGEKNMDRVDKFLSAGNRGYSVLKILRQDVWEQKYYNLPRSIRVQEGVAEALSKDVNHATGVTQKHGFKGANILAFAPRLMGSRVMWTAGDPGRAILTALDWKKSTTAQKEFAKNQLREKAWVFGTFASMLAVNQGFLAASGSKQKINGIPEVLGGAGIDPLAGDFLKFKVHGANIAYGGALLTLCKLPLRVGYAIAYEGKGSKYVLEEERVDKVVMGYLRTQASPFAGAVADLALGRDFEERPLPAKLFGTMEQTGAVPKRLVRQGVDEPYSWLSYAGTKLPIPMAEALKEGLKGSGIPDEQLSYWTKAFGIAIIMTGTGTRITEDTREE